MSSFENLIIEQRSTIEHLNRILPNYRKLGKDKFSAVKIRNHISALKEKWTMCESLHIQLQQTASEVQRNHDYFTKEEFLARKKTSRRRWILSRSFWPNRSSLCDPSLQGRGLDVLRGAARSVSIRIAAYYYTHVSRRSHEVGKFS